MTPNESYVILTDSAADLTAEMLEHMGIGSIPLNVFMKDNPAVPCTLTGTDFYNALSEGQVACTAAANLSVVRKQFAEVLAAGKDVLYLSFSSQLSCMYATTRIAAEELAEEYPDRKIVLVDTLCASMGQGLLVWCCAQNRERGMSIEDNAAFAEEKKLSILHWFTVDDLMFLKRGGRLGAASAYAGTLLGIKPVLTTNNTGKIVVAGKARGRKAAMLDLAKRYAAHAGDKSAPAFIAHAAAPDFAETLKEALQKEGAQNVIIGEISAALGAHCGPGTVALFYFGDSRE